MKSMMKITAIAVAMGIAGIASAATTTPDNIGDVTLYGNITATQTNWQWEVFDFPGGENIYLTADVATVVSGVATYDLAGSWYTAATGFTGEVSGVAGTSVGTGATPIGYTESLDILSSGAVSAVTGSDGVVTLTIPATVATGSGPVSGSMTVLAQGARANTVYSAGGSRSYTVAQGLYTDYAPGGACFVASGPTPAGTVLVSTPGTTTTAPRITNGGPGYAALNSVIAKVDATRAPEAPSTINFSSGAEYANCTYGVVTLGSIAIGNQPTAGRGGVQALALKPNSVVVPATATGPWSATLTITATQL